MKPQLKNNNEQLLVLLLSYGTLIILMDSWVFVFDIFSCFLTSYRKNSFIKQSVQLSVKDFFFRVQGDLSYQQLETQRYSNSILF